MLGYTFGRWEVLSELKGTQRRRWQCRCDCGTEKSVCHEHLVSGRSKSCGCISKEQKTTHGMSRSLIYGVWAVMVHRCTKVGSAGWDNYGGRGIQVCDRWKESFSNFYTDMGDRPSRKHSIDRIDVNGHYCPENCRWATKKEQDRNRRDTIYLTVGGVTDSLPAWAELVGTQARTLSSRHYRGWSHQEVVYGRDPAGTVNFSPTVAKQAHTALAELLKAREQIGSSDRDGLRLLVEQFQKSIEFCEARPKAATPRKLNRPR